MFELIRPSVNIDFVGKRHIWVGLSIVTIIASITLFFTKGLNYGIDFTGGAEIRLATPMGWDVKEVRNALNKERIGEEARIQRIGDPSAHEFLIRVQGDQASLNATAAKVERAMSASAKQGEYEIKAVDVVGPAAGESLRRSGFLAMFYALLAILIYVAIRFDMRYAPGAVLALFHDSVLVMGVFILAQKQFDLTILAALLALIGYSNNDTIIVFDRIRETVQMHPSLPIGEAVNRSVNETLGRTLLTSLMTFIVAFSLWMFGGSVIENFAFTFMVGIIVGSYSSIFIASSLVIYLTEHKKKKEARLRMQGTAAH